MPNPTPSRVLVIGWDAADWRVINPLMEQGKMPHLASMLDAGASGSISTLCPAYSPMLWTSIATGKRPYKHGIHGFIEPTPDGRAVRPVTNLARKTKAFWNIANQSGLTPIVVGWWPSHPAEPLDGVMVSNHYQRAPGHLDRTKPWPMLPGTVHPERLAGPLEEFRVHPAELTGDHLLPFIPKLGEIDQQKDRRVLMLAKTLAETASIHAAATALAQLEPWDVMAVYFDGIDHFCHGFMRYHPPRRPWIDERDFELYSGVIEGAYRFHDMMLGTMLALAGEDTTVILLSDHGFHPDHLRPRTIPAEPAGPAVEHRDFGIIAMSGPGVQAGEKIIGASVLDLCPTVLTLLGLPVGSDMDGKPLVTALLPGIDIKRVASWDDIEGEDGSHGPDAARDPVADVEAMRQLVDLGYVEAPNEDAGKAVAECTRELRYNLAQAYVDGRKFEEAAEILTELWDDAPDQHRYGILLLHCLTALRRDTRRRETLDRLEKEMVERARTAAEELAALQKELEEARRARVDAAGEDGAPERRPSDQELARHRQLTGLATPDLDTVLWGRIALAIDTDERDKAEALLADVDRRLAAAPEEETPKHPGPYLRLGSASVRLGAANRARRAFERALVHDPDNPAAQVGLAECDLLDGDLEAALQHAISATETLFHSPRAHLIIAQALHGLGDLEHAEQAVRVTLAQAPGHRGSLRLLLRLLNTQVDKKEKNRAEAREVARVLRRARVDAGLARAQERLAASEPIASAVPTGRAAAAVEADRDSPETSPRDPAETIIVVSGLPRSGTSLIMQMLDAAGIPVFADDERSADESNPRGYYEHDAVRTLVRDHGWLAGARGKAMKVVSPLVPRLPTDAAYRFIFMKRATSEIIRSQRRMLQRLEREGARLDDDALARVLESQATAAYRAAMALPRARVCTVSYADAVAQPLAVAQRVAEFLADIRPGLNTEAIAAAVRPELYRERAPAVAASAGAPA